MSSAKGELKQSVTLETWSGELPLSSTLLIYMSVGCLDRVFIPIFVLAVLMRGISRANVSGDDAAYESVASYFVLLDSVNDT